MGNRKLSRHKAHHTHSCVGFWQHFPERSAWYWTYYGLNRPISAHSSWCAEFADLAEDLGEAVGEPVEARAGSAL
jgi:hypothetical protein